MPVAISNIQKMEYRRNFMLHFCQTVDALSVLQGSASVFFVCVNVVDITRELLVGGLEIV
jgi:hypothetical protein